MKKLILTILFLTPLMLCAAEVTADTPAVEPTAMQQIIDLLVVGLITMIGILIKRGLPLLDNYLKEIMHFRGASVVRDALIESAEEMRISFAAAAADGKITAEEKAALKAKAKEIAKKRLENLSGFYKKDLLAWLDDRLSVELAKLLSLI